MISSINKIISNSISERFCINRSPIPFRGNATDIFQKSERQPYSKEELYNIMNGDCQKISKDFLDSLSVDEYNFCLDYAKSNEKIFSDSFRFLPKSVMPQDVKDLAKYSQIFYKGLEKIAARNNRKMEDVLLVSIGQSPCCVVQAMNLKGVKTAHCPISGLAGFREPIEKYVTKENVDKYFSYWKNFGFDLNELFGDKLIIFVDHKETGNTFHLFTSIINEIKKIKKADMKKAGKQLPEAKVKFVPLDVVSAQIKGSASDSLWQRDFEHSAFHSSYLKTLYSPLFKLSLDKISKIKEIHEASINKNANDRFNKLMVLLYEEMKHPSKQEGYRSLSSINAEREERLFHFIPACC